MTDMTRTRPRPASPKQLSFIKTLVQEKDISAIVETVDAARVKVMQDRFFIGDASNLIDLLMRQPKLGPQPIKAGVYKSGDKLFRVYLGQNSGKMLCKLVVHDEHGVSYDYLGTAAQHVPPHAERLTLEQVGSLGKTWDHCVCCGRRLDNPESVDAGIGPVCARRYDS